MSPAATARFGREISYSWVGLRLDRGSAGLPALQTSLTRLTTQVGHGYAFDVRRMDTVHRQVQDAIRPQAVALAVFGGLAALALLILVSQSVAQWLQRSAGSLRTLRAFGLTRRDAAVTSGLGPALAVVAGVRACRGGRRRPLAPGAPWSRYASSIPCAAPSSTSRCWWAAPLILVLALLGTLAAMAWRRARPRADTRLPAPSGVAQAADAAGLPRVVTLGIRFALEPPAGGRKSAVRANLAGTVVAVLAVVTAAVFGASLDGLVSHPDRYGWNWDVLIQNEGGYGSFLTNAQSRHIPRRRREPRPVDGLAARGDRVVDVRLHAAPHRRSDRARARTDHPPGFGGAAHGQRECALRDHVYRLGTPPRKVSDQIELGATTLRQLGKRVGDTVTVGAVGRRVG